MEPGSAWRCPVVAREETADEAAVAALEAVAAVTVVGADTETGM